ncbi:MAG: TIGR03084 family protein [Burkholderiaceae bacterium]|jgi:uncharacterized protein (TIGR03084 family)|nr:TIGR03084 family protein [Burkholderiaceae bacterium]
MSHAHVIADLRAEYADLAALARTLTPAQWHQASAFHGWSAWDEIAHLCYFDETGLLAATDGSAFGRDTQALLARMGRGEAISAMAREKYGHLDGPGLLAHWVPLSARLTDALAALDPKARLPWYGPSMSARSFATARLMETWAHGQDVWDVVGRARLPSARLKHIAHLGVSTYGWTFVNRQLPVPEPVPCVILDAPDGGVWSWGDVTSAQSVRGPAQDFCLVVTQRRHVADTALAVTAGNASQWLDIAQCFAGPPADGPAPGVRKPAVSA